MRTAPGNFCRGMRIDEELAGEQREDDQRSLVFDTEPLREPLVTLGAPMLDIDIASDQPAGLLVARLCDVVDGDLYGRELQVQFVDYLRPEKKFDGLDSLKAQIAADCDAARNVLTQGWRGAGSAPASAQHART